MAVAALLVRPLPVMVFQPVVSLAAELLSRRHPDAMDRLQGLEDARILIEPTDLPLCFLLTASPSGVRVRVCRDGNAAQATATIRGSFAALLSLLQGRVDGDALFFSRDLEVDGDTGAIVTLRNAIDSDEIDLVEDMLSLLGPMAGPARRALVLAGDLHHRLTAPSDRPPVGADGP